MKAEIKILAIDEIDIELQARKDLGVTDGSLALLSGSIAAAGLVNPVVVHYDSQTHTYRLISGERRLESVKVSGGTEIEARVFTDLTDLQILDMQVAENLHRRDLNPIEEAELFEDVAQTHGFNTNREIAEHVNCSEDKVARRRAMLAFPRAVRDMVANGQLGLHHANELTKKGLDDTHRIRLANMAVREGLTPEQLRDEVSKILHPQLPGVHGEIADDDDSDDYDNEAAEPTCAAAMESHAGTETREAETETASGAKEPAAGGWRHRLIADEFDLAPRILKALAEHTPQIEAIGQLVDWMNLKKDWWAKDIDGIGPAAAEEIAAAMETFWINNPAAAAEVAGEDGTDADDAGDGTLTVKLIVTVPLVVGEGGDEHDYKIDDAVLTAIVDGRALKFKSNLGQLTYSNIWRDFTEAVGDMVSDNG